MSVEVSRAGILALLTDGGRFGQHQLGLTSGGPMDPFAFHWANRLCENAPDATAIEVTVGGLGLRFHGPTRVAITGAEVAVTINGKAVERWRSHAVKADDQLKIAYAQKGCRCYVAVSGGFQVKPFLGSTSTVVREGVGGLNGQALQNGDFIESASDNSQQCWRLPPAELPRYSNWLPLRVIPGYQNEVFHPQQQRLFFQSSYQVGKLSDRMGYRLSGPPIRAGVEGILSEGICLGAIQIPADGQPIVLMNDRQTIGGYPKIGSVLSLDLARLAQLKPGDKVNFAAITLESAHRALQLASKHFASVQAEAITVD
ncbi:MAG: biotin-dependent carboxyltransferase [Gammaproteobacteria bacterium]|uniref:5-oxoprolinase/urea amidolyase family protein n=1 Tax=Pseudomaricurvus alcaniphilus TaxID=1166482 RepID=UPI00140799E5|nr:biotin-dependent carboxyltransferase [Gammaproteobacteria bacterium]NHN37316.1 biotin-dependent carboxyltransferase [Pseudomaricurvus alcaniphilus]